MAYLITDILPSMSTSGGHVFSSQGDQCETGSRALRPADERRRPVPGSCITKGILTSVVLTGPMQGDGSAGACDAPLSMAWQAHIAWPCSARPAWPLGKTLFR